MHVASQLPTKGFLWHQYRVALEIIEHSVFISTL